MRKKPVAYEHYDQVALFQWMSYQTLSYPELSLAFAVPNGGLRHYGTALKLKSEGVKAGVPDIFLPVARKGYHGLFIEMKHGNNKASALQLDWITKLSEQGYLARICYSFEEAKTVLLDYMG